MMTCVARPQGWPSRGNAQAIAATHRPFFFLSNLWLFCYYQPVRRAGPTRGRRLPSRAPPRAGPGTFHASRFLLLLVSLSFSSLSHAAVHLVPACASGRPSQRLIRVIWLWHVNPNTCGHCQCSDDCSVMTFFEPAVN